MTSSPWLRTGTARTAVGTAALRRARGTGLLALALAAATSSAVLAAPAAGAPSPELTRVVVSGAGGVRAAAAAVVSAGGTVLDSLPLVGGVSAELPTGAALAPGLTVVPDRAIELATADPAAVADGPASPVRETLGLGAPAGEGAGQLIAVIDTGVAPHPDLAGRVTSIDVSGSGTGDGYGHGTFVAGLAAGSGASSGGRYAGVAPGAQVLDVRVADADGSTDLVTVLRGLEAARRNGATVVNLSLSSYSPLPWQIDPLTVALTTLWETGTVVVVPAGNDGPDATTITSPGVAPALLTVGTLDTAGSADRTDDTVPDFSARGPAPQGVAKPELVAPGRSVVSLSAPGSVIDGQNPGARVGELYFTGSGTSFSTAVAAGAAAALRAARPLSPGQVKGLLTGSAYDADGLADPDAAGAGGLDLRAALASAAPAVTCAARGKGKKTACTTPTQDAAPGPDGQWKKLLAAFAAGDSAAAASSWSVLAGHAEAWVASSWSGLPADLREELVAEWVARSWAGGSAEQWAARSWAARSWAARSWAASSWSARSWAASSWSGDEGWLMDWDARSWAARSWAARSWAASSWSARSWSASSWAGRSWAAAAWGT